MFPNSITTMTAQLSKFTKKISELNIKMSEFYNMKIVPR